MKTIVHKFKLYQYRDGFGKDIFRLKHKGFFGYGWVCTDSYNDEIMEWKSRESVISFVENFIETRKEFLREDLLRQKRWKRTFVISEDINREINPDEVAKSIAHTL